MLEKFLQRRVFLYNFIRAHTAVLENRISGVGSRGHRMLRRTTFSLYNFKEIMICSVFFAFGAEGATAFLNFGSVKLHK